MKEESLFDFERHAPLLITPTVYGAVSILLSLALTVISHHFVRFQYAALVASLTIVLLEVGFFAKRAVLYIPMLWVWTIWLTLRITTTNYLECVENGHCEEIVFAEEVYQAIGGWQFLVSLLLFLQPFRGQKMLFLLAFSVAGSHLIPSAELPDEWSTVVRSVCFVALYYLSLIVTACYGVTESRTNSGVVKVLQSQWCLFVFNPYVLVLASVIQGMVAAGCIFLNAHNLANVRYNTEDALAAHTDVMPDGSKKSGSEDG